MPITHWTVALPLAVLLALLAVLAFVTATRGRAGTLNRSGRLGVRSAAASASDQAFVVANRVSAPIVAGAGLIGAGCALVLVLAPLPVLSVVLVFVLGALGATVLLVQAGRLGDSAARVVPVPARRPGGAGASCGGCACGSGGCALADQIGPKSASA